MAGMVEPFDGSAQQQLAPHLPMQDALIVGFSPVAAAHQVAALRSGLRRRLISGVISLAIWGALLWWQQNLFGDKWWWWLVISAAITIAIVVVMVVRLVLANRRLGRIGQGEAFRIGREGLLVDPAAPRLLAWNDITAVKAAGGSADAGAKLVVEHGNGPSYEVPLMCLDTMPGTLDGALRAYSAGRKGLDVSKLDSIW